MRIAALCLLAAAKHAGALLIEGCADEEGFVDPWGYECADWARSSVRSSRAHLAGSFPQVGYSCYYYDDDANTELLVAGCPMTCGACECVDAEGYEDPWGYACADWVGYSCYYYSDDEKTEELVANCPASCSLCAAPTKAGWPHPSLRKPCPPQELCTPKNVQKRRKKPSAPEHQLNHQT